MHEAIGGVLPFAVGVALSPMPIVAMLLMLLTPRARATGTSFLLGWIAGVAVAGAVVLAVLGSAGASDSGAPATWTGWLKVVLGVALLGLAVREWRRRPGPAEEPARPPWMAALDSVTPVKAAGLAFVLSAVNPKNLALIIGGAAVVAGADLPVADQAVTWAVFTVVASIGVATPMAIYLFLGDRAADVLHGLETWMMRSNTAVMAVLLVVIGVKLIGDGIAIL